MKSKEQASLRNTREHPIRIHTRAINTTFYADLFKRLITVTRDAHTAGWQSDTLWLNATDPSSRRIVVPALLLARPSAYESFPSRPSSSYGNSGVHSSRYRYDETQHKEYYEWHATCRQGFVGGPEKDETSQAWKRRSIRNHNKSFVE
jgi:hypothetical protein